MLPLAKLVDIRARLEWRPGRILPERPVARTSQTDSTITSGAWARVPVHTAAIPVGVC